MTNSISIKRKIVCILLILSLAFIFTDAQSSYADTDSANAGISVPVTSISTGDVNSTNYISLATEGTNIVITCTHPQAFNGLSPRLFDFETGSKTVFSSYKYYRTGDLSAGATSTFNYDCSSYPDGTYYFRLCAQVDSEKDLPGLTDYPTILSGIKITIEAGCPTLYQYENIANHNTSLTDANPQQLYCSTDLSEYKLYLFNTFNGGTARSINSAAESDYYKSCSDSIVAGIDSDYGKAFAIFQYVADNLYYDNNAKYTGRKPFDDPYYNLKALNEGTTNDYNTFDGKVAVQCDGYAGIFVALTRAQGIPSRIVYGHKITTKNTWESLTESEITTRTHTWAQCYIDGRWVNVDPQQGSLNEYGYSSDQSAWVKSNVINYCYFDISPEVFASTHYFTRILPGSTRIDALTVPNEISQLKSFLSSNSNGKKINSSYSSSNLSTWVKDSNTYTDGLGSLKQLKWPSLALKGTLNLSNFKSLNAVYINSNNLTGLTVKNCTQLKTVNASSNAITTLDASTCKNLTKLDLRYNPLTSVKYYDGSKVRTITAVSNGTFTFNYSKSLSKPVTVTGTPDIGYKVLGVYNGSTGSRVTTSKTYTFKPTASSYKIKFTLNPDSFKYTLKTGNNTTKVKPYNLAAQKRLKALKYYTGSLTGKYSTSTKSAVKAFQKKNGLKATGVVNKDTWKKLFSSKAKKK